MSGMNNLPAGWDRRSLRSLLDRFESGKRPKGGVKDIHSGVPSLGGEHLTASGGFDFSLVRYVPEEFYEEMGRGRIAPLDVLVVKDGATTGKTSIVRPDFPFQRAVVNEHVFLLRCDASISPIFLYWFLWSSEGQRAIGENIRGAAQGGITQGFADAVTIPVPPRAEQDRIVAAVESAMAAVDEAQQEIRQVVVKSQALYASLLDKALAEGDACTVGDLVTNVEAGKSFRCETRPAGDDEWGIVKVSAMTWGEFRADENKAISDVSLVNPAWEIKPGDVLVSRANTLEYVGASVLVGSCRPRLLLSDKSLRLHPAAGIDVEWLQLALSTPSARAQISSLATGTKDSMRNISQSKLKSVRLCRPPFDRQRQLVSEVGEMRTSISNLKPTIEAQLIKVDHLRRSILHRAFTGQLVPQDPGDEPASELLARIKAEKAEREAELKEAKSRSRKRSATKRNAGSQAAVTQTGAAPS